WVADSAHRGSGDRRDAVVQDKLAGYAELVAWSRLAGLLNPGKSRLLLKTAKQRPRAANAVFRRAVALRAAMYRVFTSFIYNARPASADVEVINKETRIARSHQRLNQNKEKYSWRWESSEDDLDRVLWPLAMAAADLLTSPDLP